MATDDYLNKAMIQSQSVLTDLLDALKGADAVTALVLMPIISDAARIKATIEGLIHARSDK